MEERRMKNRMRERKKGVGNDTWTIQLKQSKLTVGFFTTILVRLFRHDEECVSYQKFYMQQNDYIIHHKLNKNIQKIIIVKFLIAKLILKNSLLVCSV